MSAPASVARIGASYTQRSMLLTAHQDNVRILITYEAREAGFRNKDLAELVAKWRVKVVASLAAYLEACQ